MKMTKLKLVLSILFISILSVLQAQECGFDIKRAELLQDPAYAQLEQVAEEKIQNAIASGEAFRGNGTILTIPIVVHVLHLGEAVGVGSNISDAQIQSSIDNLNYMYRGQSPNSPIDFEIEFTLAQQDPNCNATSGVNRVNASNFPDYVANGVSFNGGVGESEEVLKNLSLWPASDYLNIWIVTEINGNNGGNGWQGYANFFNGIDSEGSVMMASVFGYDPANTNPSWPLNGNRDNVTVTHEIGHYMWLYHTFQGDVEVQGQCPADTIVGLNSDGCEDTDPHRRETSTCPSLNFCTFTPWPDGNTINNIMSYYSCVDRLTNDQKTRSRAIMGGASIVNSKGGEAPNSDFVAPADTTCGTGEAFTTSCGIIGVRLNDYTFTSGNSAQDGGNIYKGDNCTNYFEIDGDSSHTLEVGLTFNYHQLGVWIDWNNDGDFDDEFEQQHLSQDIPDYSVVSFELTYPTSIPFDSFVRMRLITDLDDRYLGSGLINSPCYADIEYGQSEEYAIYVQPSLLSVGDNELDNLNIYATSNPKEVVVKGQLTSETIASLYDIQGRLVSSSILDQFSTSNSIDVSALSSGIYIIKVFSKSQTKTQKLIIK